MLSVNPAQTTETTNATAFKGKPNKNELKKFWQLQEKLRVDSFLKNPNISKAEKQEFIIKESLMNLNFTEIFNFTEILKKFIKK